MRDYRWRAGPYCAPILPQNALVYDEYCGNVQVAGVTKAPIPWPGFEYNRGGHLGLMPILMGDLVRAVCEEEEAIVAYYWGVTLHIVNKWKAAVAGAADSNEVAVNLAIKRADPSFRIKYGY